nr:hypothetical protein [uncultured Oscillibacter sp.]
MAWFQKRVTVFRAQDKAGWLAARAALKDADVRDIRAGHYDVEPPVCGCGAKLDPRNFGPKGRIDRSMYFITVPQADAEAAQSVLARTADGKEPERRA